MPWSLKARPVRCSRADRAPRNAQAISQLESSKESVGSPWLRSTCQQVPGSRAENAELGTSTIFFVLQANQALVNAESAVVQNKISYKRSVLNLWRQTGELLDRRGVAIQ